MLRKKKVERTFSGYVVGDIQPLTIKQQHERVLEMADNVNNPKHYKRGGLECINYSRYLTFAIGTAFKNIWRAGLRDSGDEAINNAERINDWRRECIKDQLVDLKKAEWYLIDALTYLEANPAPEHGFPEDAIVANFPEDIAGILIQILNGYYTAALDRLQTLIKNMENGDANSQM